MTDATGAKIDVHSHAIPDFLRKALLAAGRKPSLSGFPAWSPELALETMARFGIAKSILSVSTPGVHYGDAAEARALARRFNEYCAGLRASRSGQLQAGQFGAFAAMPMPDVEGACEEVRYALDVLKLEGVGLLASYGSDFLGAPAYEPLMAELDARSALVFVHPAGHPTSRSLAVDYPLWMLEYPIDTTRAAVNLIMTGAVARFPRIRFILAHSGGALPFLAWRLCAAPLIDQRYAHMDADGIRAQIGRFYYEIAQAPGPEAFGALLPVADPARIFYGTDWPYCSPSVVESIGRTFDDFAGLSPQLRQAIRQGNIARELTAPA